LRLRPHAASAVVMTLGRGAAVRMGAQQPEVDGSRWRHVLVGEISGWIAADAVQPVARATPQPVPRDSQSNDIDTGGAPISPINAASAATQADKAGPSRMRVIADRLALRVTPDINAPMLRQLRAGTVVEVLPQPQRAYWTAVKAGEQRGWVASQWLVPDESGRAH